MVNIAPLRRRLSAALLREDGMALVLALGISAVFAIVGTTVMFYSSHNSSLASRSTADQRAFALAEAGINNAVSILGNPSNNALNGTLLPNTLATANVTQQDDGVVKWWGTLSGNTWTLNSFGYMRNPTGPGMGNLTAGRAILELARGDLSLATFMGVQSALAMTSISLLGSNEQKQRWLPPMARLERIGAFGLTEPYHSVAGVDRHRGYQVDSPSPAVNGA